MKKRFMVASMMLAFASFGLFANGSSETSTGDKVATTGLNYPTKTVQMICPFNPGGDSDYNARTYATRLSKKIGKSFVVVNTTGNGGATGITAVHDAKPDGYTVGVIHSSLFVAEAVGNIDFGLDDFEVACILGKNPGNVVVVNAKTSPYHTLKELIDASAANPGKITFAANIGATTQAMGLLLNQAGGDFNLVDLGDAGERIASLLSGTVDAMPNPIGTVKPYIESGDMRPLAILEGTRDKMAPEIPTAIEEGYEGCEFPIYYTLLFPKGTPQAIVEYVAKQCQEINAEPEYQADIKKTYGQTPVFIDGPEARVFLEKQEANVLSMFKNNLVN